MHWRSNGWPQRWPHVGSFPSSDRSVAVARGYLALQGVAAIGWWVAVFASDDVQRWTLGTWDPERLVVADLVLFAGASVIAAVVGRWWVACLVAVWTVAVTGALAVQGLVDQAAGWGVLMMGIASAGTVGATVTMRLGEFPVRWFFMGPFRFQVAPDVGARGHVLRSLRQLVFFWTSFLIVLPLVLGLVEHRLRVDWPGMDRGVVALIGIVVFLSASGVGLWSCITMATVGRGTPLPSATARDLVAVGPYRLVRNPMAVAGALQTTGVGLVVGSWMVLVAAVGGAVVWHLLIRPTEEADLLERLGEPYAAYRSRVRCWVPIGRR